MAKYKGREVRIVREIPHAEGDQVAIEHLELLGQTEVVPRNQVVVTKEELKAAQKAREDRAKELEKSIDSNEYRVEGETDELATPLPSYKEVIVQRVAEANLAIAEKAQKAKEDWEKRHPHAPANAKQQLDAIKVVPYKDEKPEEKTWFGKDKK